MITMYLNVTDRRTDERTTCLGNTALRVAVASRGNNEVLRSQDYVTLRTVQLEKKTSPLSIFLSLIT